MLILRLILTGLSCTYQLGAHAQSLAGRISPWATEDGGAGAAGFNTFRFNDRRTTAFGPAYADIWLEPSNFLACKPPLGRPFSYALCLYSGPAVGTPVPGKGSPAANPALPCKLSADGKSADCTCYALTTQEYPPYIPYFVDINAILNLDLYLRTVRACGHQGENCSPREPLRSYGWWNDAPVCRAANAGRVIPGTDLISVFSGVKSSDYATGASPNSTSCTTGKYAACMTAPCHDTGKRDSAGNPLVQCQCPVYDGPFEISQAGVPCDANRLTPRPVHQKTAGPPPVYVWSAAHNPALNHPSINPPASGCLPDAPDGKGCPLYSASTYYPVTRNSPLCREVCEAYRHSAGQSPQLSSQSGIQAAYTCDAALCTTIGIGQTMPAPRDRPPRQTCCGMHAATFRKSAGCARSWRSSRSTRSAAARARYAGATNPARTSAQPLRLKLAASTGSRRNSESSRSARSTAPCAARKGERRADPLQQLVEADRPGRRLRLSWRRGR